MTPEATARSLCEQLGEPAARPRRARDGREHHLFVIQLRGEERLLKFPKDDGLRDPYDPSRSPEDRLRAEASAIQLARDVEVPPDYRFHATTPVCSTMAIIPGTTAEIAYEDGKLDEDGLLAVSLQMGRTLAALHSRRRPSDPEAAAALPDLPGVDPLNARLLHLDYHLGNVMIRPSLGSRWAVAGVVDWTCARWGQPEADLVEMQVSAFVMNPRARDAFVAGYRKACGRAIDIALVERLARAEIRRRLVEDPPENPVQVARWKDWVDQRASGRSLPPPRTK